MTALRETPGRWRRVQEWCYPLGGTSTLLMMLAAFAWWGLSGWNPVLASQEHLEAFVYHAKGKRDPFIPLVRDGKLISLVDGESAPATSLSGLQLTGILWDPGGRSLALINGTEIGVGGTVEGYHVAQIRQDRVVLMRDGKSLVLQIAFEEASSTPEDTDK